MIYYKLDWFQGICLNRSLASVAELFGLDDGFDAFLAKDEMPRIRETGYGSKLVFEVDGVRLVVDKALIDVHQSLDSEFDWYRSPLDSFGLEISGSGLDILRHNGLDVDTVLCDPEWIGADVELFRPTRADFAFDFVNLHSGFMLDLTTFCERKASEGVKRLCTGRSGGVSYSVHHGPEEMTVYLGCVRSEYLLRCYDKKLQLDPQGLDPTVYPEVFRHEGEIESWFRMELQTRRQTAVTCLYQPASFRQLVDDRGFRFFADQTPLTYVLAFVRDRFLLFENGDPLPCMYVLFNWEKLPKLCKFLILYNDKLPSVVGGLDGWLTRNFRKLAVFLSVYGAPRLFDLVNDAVLYWQQNLDDVQCARKFSSFTRDLAAVISEGIDRSSLHLEEVTGNLICLKKEFDVK